MARWPALPLLSAALLAALAACAAAGAGPGGRGGATGAAAGQQAADAGAVYEGSDVLGLGGDLFGFLVRVRGARDAETVVRYVTCVVAGYTLENHAGFARQVRTNLNEEGGVWIADAVYTISPTLPRGVRTIDAEVTAADCAERGLPTA
ncbi:MAG: hypothetical protein H6895_12145 [Defluviimonas sp.]|uniref:hypothetical protein n=1 Tax=Albidovulum sp. TaxID=1872424 RepID=UPI002A2B5FFE|nr:hypothetical protein [Defluviimonas sp.]